jgi:hypothetical protein
VTKTGKCFSMVDQGQRKFKDDYGTPRGLTRLLLGTGELSGYSPLLEPAAGAGCMLEELRCSKAINRNTQIIANDLLHPIHTHNMNFMEWEWPVDIVVSNPPFNKAFEFIKKAKEIAQRKIIYILPLSYLQGSKRYKEIWQDRVFPLKSVYVYTRFPMFGDPIRDDGKFRTGMMATAVYVWDKQHSGPPTIDWLDCDEYILHGKELKDFEAQYNLKEKKDEA